MHNYIFHTNHKNAIYTSYEMYEIYTNVLFIEITIIQVLLINRSYLSLYIDVNKIKYAHRDDGKVFLS